MIEVPPEDTQWARQLKADACQAGAKAERERILALAEMRDDRYLTGMTNFKVDTRNQLRSQLRRAINKEGSDEA